MARRIPQKPWKVAVPPVPLPLLEPQFSPRPTWWTVYRDFVILLAACGALLLADAGFRTIRSMAAADAGLEQALSKAVVDRRAEALRKTPLERPHRDDPSALQQYGAGADELDALREGARSRQGAGPLRAVLADADGSMARLHQLVVFALLTATAVALGIFVLRLLAWLGITGTDFAQKLVDSIGKAGDDKAGVPGSLARLAGGTSLVLPVTLAAGAAAATIALNVDVARPAPVPLRFDTGGPIPISLAPTPGASAPAFPVSIKPSVAPVPVDFVPGKLPAIPVSVTARMDPVRVEIPSTVDVRDIKELTRKLAEATAHLASAAAENRSAIAQNAAQIHRLADASWDLFRAGYVTSYDVRALAQQTVNTSYPVTPRCTEDFFAKVEANSPQEVWQALNIAGTAFKTNRQALAEHLRDLCQQMKRKPAQASTAEATAR